MQVFYAGADITPDTSIHTARYTDRAEDGADTLTLIFNDTDRIWSGWNPQRDDEIRVIEGAIDSGIMYVDEIAYRNGLVYIGAVSLPRTLKTEKYRAFEQVEFAAVVSEIASSGGFSAVFFDTDNPAYGYLRQDGMSDALFLRRLAELEGYAVKAYDKNFVVYNPQIRELAGSQADLILTRFDTYDLKFSTHGVYAECQVMTPNGPISFKAPDGAGDRVLKIYDQYAFDAGEALRFAKGHLRRANRTGTLALVPTDLRTDISAGSVINVQGEGVPEGAWYCYKAEHDIAEVKSYLYLRKPLEGY